MQETQGSTINPILVGVGIDERFARNDVTGRTYFLTDRLNSTVALTDPTGAIQQQYSYDPYGNVTSSNTTMGFTNPYQYTGREADTGGLYYYRARYYSPMMGGFISEDPIGFGGGQNSFYSYVGGNPISYIDPLGLRLPCDKCKELREKIYRMNDLLRNELGKYDPAADAQGGFPMAYGSGITSPGGHYKEIKDLQRGLKNWLEYYYYECRKDNDDGNPPITKNVDALANSYVPQPSPSGNAQPIVVAPGAGVVEEGAGEVIEEIGIIGAELLTE